MPSKHIRSISGNKQVFMKQNEEKPKRNVLVMLGGIVGIVTIIGLLITALQLWQSLADSESQEQTQSTLIAISEQQLVAQQTLVVLQQNPSSPQELANIKATIAALENERLFAQATLKPDLVVHTVTIEPTTTFSPTVIFIPTETPSPTHIITVTTELGEEKVVLANNYDNTYTWEQGSPYTTTQIIYEGDVAFIPTGNNHFSKELGLIGYEQGEVRYITFKLYLLKQDAASLLQVATDNNWEHRWGFDGRPTFQGYGWARKGQIVNLPVGQWVDVKLDLINDLGAKPGQILNGLAFSGNDGNLIFDRVTLVSDH